MMYEYQYPFEPPIEDLKMQIKGDGATCYLFDTVCKNITKEKKLRADKRIFSIYYHNAETAVIRETKGKKDEGLREG